MISTTIVAEVVTADGTAAWKDPYAGRGYRMYQATPPDVFGDWQPGRIPVTITHGGPTVGHIDYLECALGYGNGGLYAVAVLEGVDADMIDGQVQCSPEILCDAMLDVGYRGRYHQPPSGQLHATRATLDAVALVNQTASFTSTRVRAWSGDYRVANDLGRWRMRGVPAILERAAKAARWRPALRPGPAHCRSTAHRSHRPRCDGRRRGPLQRQDDPPPRRQRRRTPLPARPRPHRQVGMTRRPEPNPAYLAMLAADAEAGIDPFAIEYAEPPADDDPTATTPHARPRIYSHDGR